MDINQFIMPELLILIPAMYCIGIGIKKSKIKSKFIPVILGATGICLSVFYVLGNAPLSTPQEIFSGVFIGITQGILCAGASVYANEMVKQSKKVE